MEDGVLWVPQRQRRRGEHGRRGLARRAVPASSRATFSSESTRSSCIVRTTSSSRCTPPPRDPASTTSCCGRGTPSCWSSRVAGIPSGTHWLYLALAGVGLFTLLVGTGVRLRRPENQATLHFFWLCVAFFGVLTFSFSGRLDLLDWVFYWGDVVAMLLLPPLFVHFALVFPERPGQLGAQRCAAARCCRCSICRRCSSARAKVAAILRGDRRGDDPDERRHPRRARRSCSTWRSAWSAAWSS